MTEDNLEQEELRDDFLRELSMSLVRSVYGDISDAEMEEILESRKESKNIWWNYNVD